MNYEKTQELRREANNQLTEAQLEIDKRENIRRAIEVEKNKLEDELRTAYDSEKGIIEGKIETPRGRFGYKEGLGKVVITSDKLLPKEFVKEKITLTPDKAAIKKAITAGQNVEGAAIVKELNFYIE